MEPTAPATNAGAPTPGEGREQERATVTAKKRQTAKVTKNGVKAAAVEGRDLAAEKKDRKSKEGKLFRSLPDSALLDRGQELAKLEAARTVLLEEKAAALAQYKGQLEALQEQIDKLVEELNAGGEWQDAQLSLDDAKNSRRSTVRPTQDLGAPVGE